MRIQVNKVHFPVTALGPGSRIGIWMQGCSIGCPGCISRDTWHGGREYETTVDALLAQCDRLTTDEVDGVTISGGEPFDQPAALAALIAGLCARRVRQATPMDILLYSGQPLERLRQHHSAILAGADAVISEPYVAARAPGGRWWGSSNQVLTALSPLGEERYVDAEGKGGPAMQVSIDMEHIWMIGVPRPMDMARLERATRVRGLEIGLVSWRA